MKHLVNVLLTTIIATVVFVASALLMNALLGVHVPEPEDEGMGLLLLFIAVLLNSTVVYVYVLHNPRVNRKWKIFTAVFGIQFFLTQIEALWFNNALEISALGIVSIILAGLLYAVAMAFWFDRYPTGEGHPTIQVDWLKLLITGGVVYAFVYHTAGYFIAWQSEALRVYYTGSSDINPYFENLGEYIFSSLFLFQIIRGIGWVAMTWFLINRMHLLSPVTPWLIAGLCAILMTAQLLIPNPYMPEEIRMVHRLEVFFSNLLWGYLMVILVRRFHARQEEVSTV